MKIWFGEGKVLGRGFVIKYREGRDGRMCGVKG